VTQVRIGKGGRREGRPKAEAGQAWYLLYCKSIKDDANLFFAWRYLFKKLGQHPPLQIPFSLNSGA